MFKPQSVIAAMLGPLKRHWFLLTLASVLIVGMGAPGKCAPLAESIPKNGVVACVLFLMAVTMSFDAMRNSVRYPGPALLAVAVNFVVVPLLAWLVSPLLPADLATGLLVAAAVPSTIASATVWTRLAGGNEAVSMLVTVVTNLACFAVTPTWIWLLLGEYSQTDSFTELAGKLFVLVVLPIALAQTARLLWPLVAEFATARKPVLSLVAQTGLLSIVFLGAVNCGQQLEGLAGRWAPLAGGLLTMLVVVAAVHTVAWWVGYRAAQAIGFTRADALAAAFAGSQKTLMVGLAIALDFGGLAILPMVAYHVVQLLIDTLLVEKVRDQSVASGP